MTNRLLLLAALAAAAWPRVSVAQSPARAGPSPAPPSFTVPLAIDRHETRVPPETLPVPRGFTREQIALGDRVFHGEAAGGQCSQCHGVDARGSATGSDLTTGMWLWADGTVAGIKRILLHNMAVAPGMDGALEPADVDAVAAYVWALARKNTAN
jgi:cytochrome c553